MSNADGGFPNKRCIPGPLKAFSWGADAIAPTAPILDFIGYKTYAINF